MKEPIKIAMQYVVYVVWFLTSYFTNNFKNVSQNLDLDSEDDKSLGKKVDLSSTIPSGTDKAPEMLDATLSALPPR
jgi:hypothetical protein